MRGAVVRTLAFMLALVLACTDSTGPADPVTVDVSPGGGTVTSSDGKTTLSLPAGAVSETTAISVTALASPPPAEGLIPGTAVQLEPSGTTFATPVQLEIEVEDSAVPSGVPLATLAVHRRTGDRWVRVPGGSVDPARRVVTAPLYSFSVYAVLFLGAPSEVVKEGDAQSVTVGQPVPVAPSVVVRSSTGAVLPGLQVSFTVAGGDGSVTGATQVTDEEGRATVGSWTLGSIPGANALQAAVEGMSAPVTFTAQGEAVQVDVTGSYDLVSVNGQPLPYLESSGTDVTTAGTLNLSAAGACSLEFTSREVDTGNEESQTIPCTYAVDGTVFTLHWEGVIVGTISDGRVTFDIPGEGTVVFVKG